MTFDLQCSERFRISSPSGSYIPQSTFRNPQSFDHSVRLRQPVLDRQFSFLHTGSVLEDLMATLNIKNLPDRLYKKIQARAHREHRSIAQEVIHILSVATENATPLSILELQGLGKDVWKKVDA